MTRRGALLLVFNGAIFLLVGMLVGFPGFIFSSRSMDDTVRLFFRQSHLIPIATGSWMIATAGVLSYLTLTDGWICVLVWALVVSGYSLLLAQSVWAAALVVGSNINDSPLRLFYYVFLAGSAIGTLIGGFLTMRGAFAALRELSHPLRALH